MTERIVEGIVYFYIDSYYIYIQPLREHNPMIVANEYEQYSEKQMEIYNS